MSLSPVIKSYTESIAFISSCDIVLLSRKGGQGNNADSSTLHMLVTVLLSSLIEFVVVKPLLLARDRMSDDALDVREVACVEAVLRDRTAFNMVWWIKMQGLGGKVGKSRKENQTMFHSLNMKDGTMFENRSNDDGGEREPPWAFGDTKHVFNNEDVCSVRAVIWVSALHSIVDMLQIDVGMPEKVYTFALVTPK